MDDAPTQYQTDIETIESTQAPWFAGQPAPKMEVPPELEGVSPELLEQLLKSGILKVGKKPDQKVLGNYRKKRKVKNKAAKKARKKNRSK